MLFAIRDATERSAKAGKYSQFIIKEKVLVMELSGTGNLTIFFHTHQ